MFLMGYSAARHVLSAYSDDEVTLLSFIWGFVTAQLAWLTFHWTIAYTIPFTGGMKLPQITIIILAISFLAERVYASYAKHGEVRSSEVMLPALLSLSLIGIMLFLFNGVSTGNI